MKPLSTNQRACIIQATIDPLSPFRRGFARTKAGPFFNLRTVSGLIQRGSLRMYHPVMGKSRVKVSARTV